MYNDNLDAVKSNRKLLQCVLHTTDYEDCSCFHNEPAENIYLSDISV